MDQLLLFEYLHADPEAFQQAPSTMRREGHAMLSALLADCLALPDTHVSIVLCRSALSAVMPLPDPVQLHLCGDGDDPLQALQSAATAADVVLPVAPECDGILLQTALTLETLPCTTLLPPVPLLRTCSDKLLTWKTFQDAGIPMLPCQIPDAPESSLTAIFKPRFGAGCDGVRKGILPANADPQEFIQQPWIKARSLSVGVLCGPQGNLPLPAAAQRVCWNDDQPEYRGGMIPAEIGSGVQRQISSIVRRVLQNIGDCRGYLGLDFLVSDADDTVYLNEINPRVCTSYVGYRRLLSANPLLWMLGQIEAAKAVDWSGSIDFDADQVP